MKEIAKIKKGDNTIVLLGNDANEYKIVIKKDKSSMVAVKFKTDTAKNVIEMSYSNPNVFLILGNAMTVWGFNWTSPLS